MKKPVSALLALSCLLACGPAPEAAEPAPEASAASPLSEQSAAPRAGSVQLSTGVTLRYVEQGRQDGPVVVFLHGYTDSHHTWDLNLPSVPRRFHAYALDQRGHGDSSRPACCYTQSDFAADVVAFLDAMGVQRATLVGHSMGSFIAQQVALEYPARVEALVLVGSAPTVAGNAVALGLMEAVNTLTDPVDPAFIREFQAGTFYRPIPASYLDTLVSESGKLPARVWQAALSGLIAENHASRLGEISVPTLVVSGDQDGFFSVADGQALASAIPNATFVLYAGTGHGIHAEQPHRFGHDLQRFLKSLE
jgi:pimeloyl-ACP methyl ester carboxylesterase